MNVKTDPHAPAPEVVAGPKALDVLDVVRVARGQATLVLASDPAYRTHLQASVQCLEQQLAAGRTVYGVTTGFGENCQNPVELAHAHDLSLNLLRFHGCGTGRILSPTESAAVVAVRLASLCRGYSGVRPVVLERLAAMLECRLLPQIPSEGSVGASGDLTPLSYVAAALVGEREVTLDGEVMEAKAAWRAVGLDPIQLGPKEALAIMNGTSVMTGLACLAWDRAQRLARWAAALTAMGSDVTQGNPRHFDDRIFALKPHPGQRAAARWIREDVQLDVPRTPARVQDRYSIRCAPHVLGVLLDSLDHWRGVIGIELNSVNDNPILDPYGPPNDAILHGGNFYGGHIAMAMDGLKTAVANVADLLDRQFALLANAHTSHGLPDNLVARQGGDTTAHHGFKAMQISASALTAEALKLTMPASVFSRSTECHNQDKVPMGTIAARDALRVLDLTETVAAVCTLALCQAVDLREQQGCFQRSLAMHAAVRERVPMNVQDRRMDGDIAQIQAMHHTGRLPWGDADFPDAPTPAQRAAFVGDLSQDGSRPAGQSV